MQSFESKISDNRTRASASGISTIQNKGIPRVTFNDNRHEMVAQNKLQDVIRSASVYQRLVSNEGVKNIDSSPSMTTNDGPIQLKTSVEHDTANFKYRSIDTNNKLSSKIDKTETVGTRMKAWLDPKDSVTGSAPGGDQDNLMKSLKLQGNLASYALIKGHLLNHDLGGFGVAENLFPITKQANVEHLVYAEYAVKQGLADAYSSGVNGRGVYYEVQANGPGNCDDYLKSGAFFSCAAYTADTDNKKKGTPLMTPIDIQSDVGSAIDKAADYVNNDGTLVTRRSYAPALKGWEHAGSGRKGDFNYEKSTTNPNPHIKVNY